MKITRSDVKANVNRISKATGADRGILKNISDSLSSHNFKEMNIDLLEDFPNHKFNAYSDDELKSLSDNIKMVGLLDPITVWDTNEGHYYILCGHNRVRACRLAGFKKVTCNIKKYNNLDEAKLAVIASNLDRRGGFESLSVEEKCLVIVEDFDTLKKLYKENKDKYGIADVVGFDAKTEVSVHYKLGSTQASMYYRVGKTFRKEWLGLIPKHFNFKTAYQLSLLQKDNLRRIIEDIISTYDNEIKVIKISESKAKEIRSMEKNGEEIDNIILSLYSSKQKTDKTKYVISFENEIFAPYYEKIKSIDEDTLNSIFSGALEKYFNT